MNSNRSLIYIFPIFLTVLLLGSVGFYDLAPEEGWLTSLYKSAQLFSMGSGVLEGKKTPILIEISRWLAVITVVSFVYATYIQFTSLVTDIQERRRLAALSGHSIVCGAGNRGREIAKAMTSSTNDHPIVVIEIDGKNPALGELRNLATRKNFTLLIIHGNALDETVLEKAGIQKARTLIAVTGNDEKNLSICAEARRMNPNSILSAGIESWGWRSFYLDRLQCQIRLDSYLIRAARKLTLDLACDAVRSPQLRLQGVHLLIEADPVTRQELIRATAINLQISGDKRPVIQLTLSTEKEEQEFNDRFPESELAVELIWHRESASRTLWRDGTRSPDFAIFALNDDVKTLEAADRCRMRSATPSRRIVACLRSGSDPAEMPAIRRRQEDFRIENIFNLGLGSNDPTEMDVEEIAKQCHARYIESCRRADSQYDAKPESLSEEWDRVPERIRESNRLLAMHHTVKRVAWAHRADSPELEMLTHLCRSEHMRWMAEKVMDGWRKGAKNPERLTHHLLVPYDELPTREIKKDVDAFLWALNLNAADLGTIDSIMGHRQITTELH